MREVFEVEINLIKGARKRDSCFFNRRDTISGVFRMPVCEKSNFKKPSIGKCAGCTVYTPYLSMADLAERERQCYAYLPKELVHKTQCNVCGKDIKTNNPDIKKCRTGCNTLLAFIGQPASQPRFSAKIPAQRKLGQCVRYI